MSSYLLPTWCLCSCAAISASGCQHFPYGGYDLLATHSLSSNCHLCNNAVCRLPVPQRPAWPVMFSRILATCLGVRSKAGLLAWPPLTPAMVIKKSVSGHVCRCWKATLHHQSHAVAQDGLKLVILLPLSPMCWDFRHEL